MKYRPKPPVGRSSSAAPGSGFVGGQLQIVARLRVNAGVRLARRGDEIAEHLQRFQFGGASDLVLYAHDPPRSVGPQSHGDTESLRACPKSRQINHQDTKTPRFLQVFFASPAPRFLRGGDLVVRFKTVSQGGTMAEEIIQFTRRS